MATDQSRECWGGEYDGGALETYCGSRGVGSGVRVSVALVLLSVAGTSLKLVAVICRTLINILNFNKTFWE
jgi:hypothetical protein